jgi:hypothetical protein
MSTIPPGYGSGRASIFRKHPLSATRPWPRSHRRPIVSRTEGTSSRQSSRRCSRSTTKSRSAWGLEHAALKMLLSESSRPATSVQERRRSQINLRPELLSCDLMLLGGIVRNAREARASSAIEKRSVIEQAALLRAPATASQMAAQSSDHTPRQNSSCQPAYRSHAPKRRPRPVQIARLYPEAPSAPLRQARALIELIREECPDFVGRYIPRSDLERTYRELCAAESWEPHHWTAIARQLGGMTKKREVKRAGVRFIAYQIPSSEFR